MPLAYDIRPNTLEEFVGQKHLVGENGPIYKMIKNNRLTNMILYGPPGTGKTTLATILANVFKIPFYKINASVANLADLKEIVDSSTTKGEDKILLFVDELHLFKKNIQQYLLDYVENGKIVLIGSTAENPYFTIHKAILSRANVFELKPLSKEDIIVGLKRGVEILKKNNDMLDITIDERIYNAIASISNGDMRCAINKLELIFYTAVDYNTMTVNISTENISDETLKRAIKYDSNGDDHFDTLSAFMKSLRGSDVDAAIHYLARLIIGGDLQGICRRLLCSASEDIGMANPQAVTIVKSCVDNALQLGFPEARLPLAEATIYLALSPKSNSAIIAIDTAINEINHSDVGDIPPHLRDAHYSGAANLGHGIDYKYPHDFKNDWVEQQYLPNAIKDHKYYLPKENKNEQAFKSYWENIKK